MRATAVAHLRSGRHAPALLALFERQGGRCAYSGRSITIGIDAELDHIVPRVKGGPGTLENFQWVCEAVNFMKRDLLEEDFLALVREIAAYRLPRGSPV